MPFATSSPEAAGAGPRGPWRVAALLRAVADQLQARFGAVSVQGELSSFTRAPSGHCYFALKDDASAEPALIRGAMFRRAAALLDFEPREGQLVEIRGRLAVYDARGDLQLVAEAMRPAGQGALYEQFLRLKARLEAEGLFDPARKRPLPRHVFRVGLITSLQAAALHDVLTALKRRAPHLAVVIYPASVQGDAAPRELLQALALAGQRREVEVLMLCRGGGSLEDLWAFNDEALARAIAASPLPVISAVGHETDFTIADFVADLRAPTPTAAAELVTPARDDSLAVLASLAHRLRAAQARRLDTAAQRLDQAALRLARPAQVLAQRRRQLALLGQRLAWAPGQQVRTSRDQQRALAQRLIRAAQVRCQRAGQQLGACQARLVALDPQRVLQRGYAYLTDGKGQALVSVASVRVGDTVQAVMSDGTLVTEVGEVRKGKA
jgi:exodeoxyribonuclease VII large subunit